MSNIKYFAISQLHILMYKQSNESHDIFNHMYEF